MFYGVSHIDLPVKDLEKSRTFYVEAMGFAIRNKGESWVDVDSSTLMIRLRQSEGSCTVATLRIQIDKLEEGRAHLIAAGAQPATEIERTEELEMVTVLLDPDQHRIVLWRHLSEDEYGFNPMLPKEKQWHPEAEQLLHDILRNVPALFRAIARRRITAMAESLTTETVDNITVVRAAIMATARVMRRFLRQPLHDLGYDPALYQEEFES